MLFSRMFVVLFVLFSFNAWSAPAPLPKENKCKPYFIGTWLENDSTRVRSMVTYHQDGRYCAIKLRYDGTANGRTHKGTWRIKHNTLHIQYDEYEGDTLMWRGMDVTWEFQIKEMTKNHITLHLMIGNKFYCKYKLEK